MRINIKKLLYLIVLNCLSLAHAGAYDDFFSAIVQDNATEVSELLARGFDPNAVDPAGQAGLLLAIKSESIKVAELLASAPQLKAEVRNSADESPLMLAALKGHIGLCRVLIAKGADVNKTGWAPLHYAATGGHLEVLHCCLRRMPT